MDPILIVLRFALLMPAIIIHEVSHGWAAYFLGDTTAKDQGRLSLNPLRHIDPWGTILLPLLMVATLGFGFGYAKPVPVNPYRFRDYRMGMFLTGIAGPASNLVMAAASGLLFRVFPENIVGSLLYLFALMNLALMFFNLIPIPPLDGSRVLPLFLSDRALETYHALERQGFIILILLLWLLPSVLKIDPLGWYFSVTVMPLLRLFTGV
ncbi:MAG: site-2 protease family protein [Coriobacteriia bacterium]|nr:site-2 protease family protein [Coriobacteriia bacterium]